MPRFFVEFIEGSQVLLTGADAAHMCKSADEAGGTVTLCDTRGFDYHCVIQRLSSQEAALTNIDKHRCENEPSVSVILYQGAAQGRENGLDCPKKPWSLGFLKIVPVEMERCVSRPDQNPPRKDGALAKIANEAAKQCGRGILPQVSPR